MILTTEPGSGERTPWAVVLAGGGGSRLRGCTVDSAGLHVPKQYCLVEADRTPLRLAIERARQFTDPDHVIVVVARQHRKWWEPQLTDVVPPGNVLSQPMSRGTAVGAVLPLLYVMNRDPDAHLVLLPADHYFRDEARLGRAIRRALDHTYRAYHAIVLIGIAPDSATSDFGYIVPHSEGEEPRPVAEFVEKPSSFRARQLIARGGLWNTAILAARGRCLLRSIRDRFPHTVDALRVATARVEDPGTLSEVLAVVYPGLTSADLSRDVLQRTGCSLVVTRADAVGWSELGTPERVTRFWDEIHPSRIGLRADRAAGAKPPPTSRYASATPSRTGPIRLQPPETR